MLDEHCWKSIVDLWMLYMNIHEMKLLLNSKRNEIMNRLIRILFNSHESNKENSPRNNKKSPEEMTADSIASDNAVQRARAELRVLEQERSKLDKQRKTQLKDFETAKSDARRLLEVWKQNKFLFLFKIFFRK
jgi:hypothetical protein